MTGHHSPDHPAAQLGRMPVRIQRRRIRGWRMPEGARYVGRPTRWGNPTPHDGTPAGREAAVAAYRHHLVGHPELVVAARRELAGWDLACWCPVTQPCHAQVLLMLANPQSHRYPSPRGGAEDRGLR